MAMRHKHRMSGCDGAVCVSAARAKQTASPPFYDKNVDQNMDK